MTGNTEDKTDTAAAGIDELVDAAGMDAGKLLSIITMLQDEVAELRAGSVTREAHEAIVHRIMAERKQAQDAAARETAARRRVQGETNIVHLRARAFSNRLDAVKGLMRSVYENDGTLPEARRPELRALAEDLGW